MAQAFRPAIAALTAFAKASALKKRCCATTCLLLFAVVSYGEAAERYALIVTGASGGEAYEQKYATWRTSGGISRWPEGPSWSGQ